VVDYILKEGETYDRVIFDTAAVANAVRLIGLSKIYGLWLTRMIDSRKEALSMRVQLSFRKERVMEEVKKDPLMADLMSMNERFDQAKGVLVDPESTAFFFVTLPLALPIAVVRRFIGMVQKFNIPIGGVIVNDVVHAAFRRATRGRGMKPTTRDHVVAATHFVLGPSNFLVLRLPENWDLRLGRAPMDVDYTTYVDGVRWAQAGQASAMLVDSKA